MSWAFMAALEKKPQQSYVELLNSIRDLLESKYSQLPQLSASHPIGKSTDRPLSRAPLTDCLRHELLVHHLI